MNKNFLILIVTILFIGNVFPREIDWSSVVKLSDVFLNHKTSNSLIKRERKEINNQQEVIPHSFNYHAAIFQIGTPQTVLCAGTLISTRTILSSVQCVFNVPEILVILGAHNINQIEPTQQRFTVTSSNILTHPDFFPVSMANDLSIITLPTSVQLTAAVNIAQLPSQAQIDELFVGELATAIGFGATNPTVLRSVENTIMTNAQCAGFYGPVIVNQNIICMNIDQNIVGDLCTADWGSGVVLHGTRLLIGVKSIGGPDACRIGLPAGLSRVTSFLGWIEGNIVG